MITSRPSTSDSARVRILVVDDHQSVRDGLKSAIDAQPDMVTAGEAADGEEAVRMAESQRPDVVLMDVSMPGWTGVQTTQRLIVRCPKAKVIAVTRHQEPAMVQSMLAAGAHGYVLKQSLPAGLLDAIRMVAGGGSYVDGAIAGAAMPQRASTDESREPRSLSALTALELKVLSLIARSHSHAEIARRLGMSAEEVAATKKNAMRKAGLTTRVQVVDCMSAQARR